MFKINWVLVRFGIGSNLALMGLFMFMVGWHDLDLGQNMKFLEARYNMSLEDVSLSGKVYSSFEAYMVGAKLLFIGFFVSIYGFYELGYSYSKIKTWGVLCEKYINK